MFTTHHGSSGHAARSERRPTKVLRLAALLGTLFVVSIAVNALIILADSNIRQPSSTAADCSVITEKGDRLACYDAFASQPAPHPAKGANAPVLFH
jgi:hypothetical protein